MQHYLNKFQQTVARFLERPSPARAWYVERSSQRLTEQALRAYLDGRDLENYLRSFIDGCKSVVPPMRKLADNGTYHPLGYAENIGARGEEMDVLLQRGVDAFREFIKGRVSLKA